MTTTDDQARREAIDALRKKLTGKLFEPGDAGYDAARAGRYTKVEHRPLVIVQPVDKEDIISVLAFAYEDARGVAVQNTGLGGVLPCDDILIDTSLMKRISFSLEGDIATVEPGVTWVELIAAAHQRGLVVPTGFVASAGVVGDALGGGIGWFSRELGYAADSIVGAELVTSDGRIVDAANPDAAELLWGLRGGSGNFGVVAALDMRCYPIASVYAGSLVFALTEARDVVQRFAAWATTLPNACTPSVTIATTVSDPDSQAAAKDRTIVKLDVCYNGSEAEGAAAMAIWDDLQPLSSEIGMLETAQLERLGTQPPTATRTYSDCIEFVQLPDAAIEAFVAPFARRSAVRLIEIRAVGGATLRPRTASAAGDGQARFIVHVQAAIDDHVTRDEARQAVDDLLASLRPYATGGAALCYLPDGEDAPEITWRAFDLDSYERLQVIKFELDPNDQFRYNHNIEEISDGDLRSSRTK